MNRPAEPKLLHVQQGLLAQMSRLVTLVGIPVLVAAALWTASTFDSMRLTLNTLVEKVASLGTWARGQQSELNDLGKEVGELKGKTEKDK